MNEELHGWKEIAAYLGRSVRGAQRWERELGLPVRRLKTAAGQAIFARRDEIEAWKARQGGRPAAIERRAWHLPVIAMAAVATLVAGGVATFAWRTRAEGGVPVAFAYDGSALVARSSDGAIVWTRDLSRRFDAEYGERTRPALTRGVIEGDVDGDGIAEIFAVIPGIQGNGRTLETDVLICLSRDGKERWRYAPDASEFRFGPALRAFEGPWSIRDVAVSPSGGAKGVWIAVAHHTWWPSAVYRLDERGRAALAYVQSGSVYGLAITGAPESPAVVAAGVMNEIGAATLALLDPDRPSTSPQLTGGEFECRNCPSSRPIKVVALPRSELNDVMPMPYNTVNLLHRVPSGLQARVFEAFEPPRLFASSIFEFDESLNVRSRSLDDSYWTLHEQWHRGGRVDHPASSCPERARMLQIREWTGNGWSAKAIGSRPLPAPGR